MKYTLFVLALLALPALALAQATTTGTGFVPLTNVPFIEEAGNAFSLESFLNGLYRIAIGIAAVVAVLQIMRAGILYMGGDSVTEKKEAKNLIALSIGGLILVLSPVVVFSIIKPEILSLKIGNLEKLKPNEVPQASSTPPTLPGTEQGVCTINYVELARGMDCSAAGPDWETASLSCCDARLITGEGFCCGRKPSAPPPPSNNSWSYTIAVKQRNIGNLMVPWCIAYEQGTDSDVTACATKSITRTQQLSAANTEYVVTHECNGETRSLPVSMSDLPTCAP